MTERVRSSQRRSVRKNWVLAVRWKVAARLMVSGVLLIGGCRLGEVDDGVVRGIILGEDHNLRREFTWTQDGEATSGGRRRGGEDEGEGSVLSVVVALTDVKKSEHWVMALPTSWTIEGGEYDGETIAITPNALRSRRGRESFWLPEPPTAWPDSLRPIPVRISVRGRRENWYAVLDLMARTIEGVEGALGENLFAEPIAVESTEQSNSEMCDQGQLTSEERGVIICVQESLSNLVMMADLTRATLGATAVREKCAVYDESDTCLLNHRTHAVIHIDADVMTGRNAMTDFVVSHELMHALGFGHTCYFATIMRGVFDSDTLMSCNSVGQAPLFELSGITDITIFDVAYVQVSFAMMEELSRLKGTELRLSRRPFANVLVR